MKTLISLLIISTLSIPLCAADGVSALSVATESAKCENAMQSIQYIQRAIPDCTTSADRRSLYAYLGNVQELLSLYDDARESYAKAAAISASDADGMSPVTAEDLVLSAIRCALSVGDWKVADTYLASDVQRSKDRTVRATIALYKTWSALCRADTAAALKAPIDNLRSYIRDDAYASIHAPALLTLWYVTGDNTAADKLTRDMPQSTEAAIVQGKARMLPVPFWYFMVRMDNSNTQDRHSANTTPSTVSASSATPYRSNDSEEENTERPSKLQLGLFRERANAQRMTDTLTAKGFSPVIASEKRTSGNTYYIVVIEHPTRAIEDALRTAGFEFYPVFQ